MRVVVDASVAVKWYLEEDHADTARGLLDGTYQLIVPDLFLRGNRQRAVETMAPG